MIAARIEATLDYFSFDLLLRTLFAPYRQIAAGSVDGPLEAKLRALVDKLFSRLIGGFIRIVIIIIGGLVMAFQVMMAILILIGWALVPLLPIVGLVLTLMRRLL